VEWLTTAEAARLLKVAKQRKRVSADKESA
jgi:hypothetical protein